MKFFYSNKKIIFASMSMKDSIQKLERIAEGWKNVAFLSPTVEAIAKVRAKICSDCDLAVESFWTSALGDTIEEAKGMKCKHCNCPLSAKTRSLKEWCPHPDGSKW